MIDNYYILGSDIQITETLLNEPQLDCSSPSEMKKLMVRMQVHKVTSDFQKTLQEFNATALANNPDRCEWIQCKLMPTAGSNGCAVAEVTHCTSRVQSCSK